MARRWGPIEQELTKISTVWMGQAQVRGAKTAGCPGIWRNLVCLRILVRSIIVVGVIVVISRSSDRIYTTRSTVRAQQLDESFLS